MQEIELKIKWSYDTLQAIKMCNYHELVQLMQKEKELNADIISSVEFFTQALILDETLEQKHSILDILAQCFSFDLTQIQDFVWLSLFGAELDTEEKRFPLKQRIDYLPATTFYGADYFKSFTFLMGRYFSVELVNTVLTQLILFEQHKEDALIYLLEVLKKYNFIGLVDKYLIQQAYSITQFKSLHLVKDYFSIFDSIDDTHLVYYMAYITSQKNKEVMLEMVELLLHFNMTPEKIRMACFQADQSYLQPIDYFYSTFNEFLDFYQHILDTLPILTEVIELPLSSTYLALNDNTINTHHVVSSCTNSTTQSIEGEMENIQAMIDQI